MKVQFWILLFCVNLATSQVLNVTVNVEYSHLPDDQQDELEYLSERVEQYYNNYEWVEDEYETDVACNVRIIIEAVQKQSSEKLYKAQFLITSSSGETFYDKVWNFPFDTNTSLLHTIGIFNPLTGFLDYYAYMILAGELDTYDLLLGTPLYEKARQISSEGLLSRYSKGWAARNEQLLKILHVRTRPLREVKPDFFEALYLYEEGKYKEAYKFSELVYEGIKKVYKYDPNNKYLSLFFDAHHKEIAQLFEGKTEELGNLTVMDSKHRETYREYISDN